MLLVTLVRGTVSIAWTALSAIFYLLSILKAMLLIGVSTWAIWWIVDRIRSVMIGKPVEV